MRESKNYATPVSDARERLRYLRHLHQARDMIVTTVRHSRTFEIGNGIR